MRLIYTEHHNLTETNWQLFPINYILHTCDIVTLNSKPCLANAAVCGVHVCTRGT